MEELELSPAEWDELERLELGRAEWDVSNELLCTSDPCLKLTSMILLLAIKDKTKTLTITRDRRGLSSIKLDDQEMVPPPRHIVRDIFKILRKVCRKAESCTYSFTETKDEQKLQVTFNYDLDVNFEIQSRLFVLVGNAKDQLAMENRIRKQRRVKKTFSLIVATLIAIALVFVTTRTK